MINIQMKKDEAMAFFGGVTRTAKIIGVTHSYVSQWGIYVPENQAFKLLYLSKSPKYRRRRPKLDCKVDIT